MRGVRNKGCRDQDKSLQFMYLKDKKIEHNLE